MKSDLSVPKNKDENAKESLYSKPKRGVDALLSLVVSLGVAAARNFRNNQPPARPHRSVNDKVISYNVIEF